MKKLLSLLLVACICITCAVIFAGCGSSESSINGTYYLYDGGTDRSSWVKLNGSSWSDSDGMSGSFKKTDETINFYITFEGSEELLLSGTLRDGKLTVNGGIVSIVYYLEGKEPQSNEEANTSSGELTFTLNEETDTYYVTGIGTFTGAKLVIPSEYNGKPVTGVEGLGHVKSVTEIVIPDSVTYIGMGENLYIGAFEYVTNLESIDFGNGVEYIPSRACYGLKKLKSVTFGTSVTRIGERAFNRTGIVNLVIPEGVTQIDKFAFMQCESLGTVELPSSLRYIDQQGFSSCYQLKSIIYNGSEADWSMVTKRDWAIEPHDECVFTYKK